MIHRFAPSTARHGTWRRSAGPLAAVFAIVAGLALTALVGTASAASSTTLATAKNQSLAETIVVDAHGLTLYELRPETVHHLLCTKSNGCFQVWRPVTVASAKTKLKAAHGVASKLGTLHRNGFFQVTLGGHPLYRFAGDGLQRGAAKGQDLHSFGGTWHVIVTSGAGASPVSTPTSTPTTPMTPTTTTPTTPTTPTPMPTPMPPYYPLGL